jgi:hypothetical protein
MPNTALAERMLRSIVDDPGFFLDNAHPNLAVEFPFGEANGFPTRITGRENLEAFLANMPNILPKLVSRLTNRETECWQPVMRETL